jgi:hypothetical protein
MTYNGFGLIFDWDGWVFYYLIITDDIGLCLSTPDYQLNILNQKDVILIKRRIQSPNTKEISLKP